MDIIKLFIQVLAIVSGGVTALLSVLFFVRLRWPAPALWFLKLYTSALSPVLAFVGILTFVAGLATRSAFITLIGFYAAVIFFLHIFKVTRPPGFFGSFQKAFGPAWKETINPDQERYFLRRRNTLRLPTVPQPRFERDIPFATIPGSTRQLLCDIWQPAQAVASSGLAFIYLHGSAWYMLDKDLGTRPFFAHLAAQGHVIMDVAYRLAPETDMMGMVHDVKRAVAWMKEHARVYGVKSDRIVIGGGSAGGHLALLAAYTADDARFTPEELTEMDTEVCAVISLYGPADMEPMYFHLNQHLTTRSTPDRPKKPVPTELPKWVVKKMGDNYHRLGMDKGFENAGSFPFLLGGHPDECPEQYALFSPVNHVHNQCPPTLLIHGAHDVMAPVKSTLLLFRSLRTKKIPTVMHILPQTDHAFDLQLPKISPSAHNAIYDVERFLALMLRKQLVKETTGYHSETMYV